MLDQNTYIMRDGLQQDLGLQLFSSTPITRMFQIWMAELSRDMLRLGVYFHALGIMLQIPGVADYEWETDEDDENEYDEDPLFLSADEDTVFTVLAEALERLGAGHLMAQLPDADCETVELDDEWTEMLDRRQEQENGLLSVVAVCLDRLIVDPGMAEIVRVPEQPWWNQWIPQR